MWQTFLKWGDSALIALTGIAMIPAVQAALGPVLGPAAPVVGIVASLIHTALLPEPVTAKPAGSVTLKMLAMVLIPASFMLGGCATISGWLGTPTGQAVAAAAVDVAVATAEQKGVPATQINAIAKQALAADQGTSTTLAAVAAVVNSQLAKLNLPPGDLAAANILEVALEAEIQSKIGINPSVATAQATIAGVLQEVITATGG